MSLQNKFMYFRKKERCKYHSPSSNVVNGKKGLLSKKMEKNHCTHCNMMVIGLISVGSFIHNFIQTIVKGICES
jgi:hypothetical protein